MPEVTKAIFSGDIQRVKELIDLGEEVALKIKEVTLDQLDQYKAFVSFLEAQEYTTEEGLKDLEYFRKLIAIGNYYAEDKGREVSLEMINSIIPKNYVMANTKIANQLTKNFLEQGVYQFETAKRNSEKKAPVYAYFKFDSDNVNLPKNYTPYDREVFNSVCSLYDAGNLFIWPEQIYRTMTGQTNTDRVSPQAVENIKDSLIKQMLSLIEIDFTAQAKLYKKSIKDDECKMRGNMLYLKEYTATINGQTITGYNVLAKPIYTSIRRK